MSTELKMPQMGYDMQQGTVVRWLKSEGAEVRQGEPIAEIETDKAVVEFESYESGVLLKLLVQEGVTVPVGQAIAIVGAEGEVPPDVDAPAPEGEAPPDVEVPVPDGEAPSAEGEPAGVEVPAPEGAVSAAVPLGPPASAVPLSGVRASPVARRLAEEHDVDLADIKGTGPAGRITRDDVLAYVDALSTAPAPTPAPAEVEAVEPAPPAAPTTPTETVPLSRMRQQIARVTVRSKQEIPHFYVSSEINMTQAMSLRQQVNEGQGVRITVNDLVIKACVGALEKHPNFNAFYGEDGMQMHPQINIGVAIAEEERLIVPAIMDCAGKSLVELAAASTDLAARAKSGTLHPQEYTGGTFSISNLGMFEVTSFAAIIHPPQAAVLAVGSVAKRPVVDGDQIKIAQTMIATLSADHRVADGAEGALFLMEVKRLLESPYLLLS